MQIEDLIGAGINPPLGFNVDGFYAETIIPVSYPIEKAPTNCNVF